MYGSIGLAVLTRMIPLATQGVPGCLLSGQTIHVQRGVGWSIALDPEKHIKDASDGIFPLPCVFWADQEVGKHEEGRVVIDIAEVATLGHSVILLCSESFKPVLGSR